MVITVTGQHEAQNRRGITVVNSKTSDLKIILERNGFGLGKEMLNDDLNGFQSTQTMIIKRPIAGNKYVPVLHTPVAQIALKGKLDVCFWLTAAAYVGKDRQMCENTETDPFF